MTIALLVALASTAPKMPIRGWSSWTQFRCHVNESLVLSMADAIVSSGLRDAGYKYVLLDDCWTACESFSADGSCMAAATRGADGEIPVNNERFPRGMRALTEAIHARGLLAGIYTSIGHTTCAGFVGSLGHEAVDAKSFAAWGQRASNQH